MKAYPAYIAVEKEPCVLCGIPVCVCHEAGIPVFPDISVSVVQHSVGVDKLETAYAVVGKTVAQRRVEPVFHVEQAVIQCYGMIFL